MIIKPIKIEDFLQQNFFHDDDEQIAAEQLLIDEGLELLRSYKAISDPNMRKTVRDAVKRLSATYINRSAI